MKPKNEGKEGSKSCKEEVRASFQKANQCEEKMVLEDAVTCKGMKKELEENNLSDDVIFLVWKSVSYS